MIWRKLLLADVDVKELRSEARQVEQGLRAVHKIQIWIKLRIGLRVSSDQLTDSPDQVMIGNLWESNCSRMQPA